MRVWSRLFTVLGATVGLGLACLSPVAAGAGPTISVSPAAPAQVDPNGIVTIWGSGCPADSQVSFRMSTESNPLDLDTRHGGLTNVRATSSGSFTYQWDLRGYFGPGRQIAVYASCGADYDAMQASPAAHILTRAAAPTLALFVPARVGYGATPTITVSPTRTFGAVTVWLDGVMISSRSAGGSYVLRPGGALRMGTHTVTATTKSADDPTKTLSATARFTVAKAPATVRLTPSRRTVKKGKKVTYTIRVTSSGPLNGKVRIRDGKKVRRTVNLTVRNRGVKRVAVKMPALGNRKLTAVFVGNKYTNGATSARTVVTVKKRL